MQKVALKIKLTIVEYRGDKIIGIYLWLTFSHTSQRHSRLSINQTEPSGKIYSNEKLRTSTYVLQR